jgi:hypothetical protein
LTLFYVTHLTGEKTDHFCRTISVITQAHFTEEPLFHKYSVDSHLRARVLENTGKTCRTLLKGRTTDMSCISLTAHFVFRRRMGPP